MSHTESRPFLLEKPTKDQKSVAPISSAGNGVLRHALISILCPLLAAERVDHAGIIRGSCSQSQHPRAVFEGGIPAPYCCPKYRILSLQGTRNGISNSMFKVG
jgi:hypothetical protein